MDIEFDHLLNLEQQRRIVIHPRGGVYDPRDRPPGQPTPRDGPPGQASEQNWTARRPDSPTVEPTLEHPKEKGTRARTRATGVPIRRVAILNAGIQQVTSKRRGPFTSAGTQGHSRAALTAARIQKRDTHRHSMTKAAAREREATRKTSSNATSRISLIVAERLKNTLSLIGRAKSERAKKTARNIHVNGSGKVAPLPSADLITSFKARGNVYYTTETRLRPPAFEGNRSIRRSAARLRTPSIART